MRLARSLCWLVTAPLLLVAGGCGDDGPGAAATTAATAPPAAVLGNATVRGVVTFHGQPPAAEQVEAKDCHTGGGTIEVTPVRVDDAGRLRDVVVFLKHAPAAAGTAAAGPVVLDQVNCEYVPHVVALRVGQTLRVKSSDPTLHNVHGLPSENAAFNFGMVGAGQTKDLTFAAAESFKVKCDVHPWMSAAVHVFDHPFFTVAGPDGAYELANLPAGEHTLVFRHDRLGDVEVKVKVEDGKAVVADAAFGRRAT